MTCASDYVLVHHQFVPEVVQRDYYEALAGRNLLQLRYPTRHGVRFDVQVPPRVQLNGMNSNTYFCLVPGDPIPRAVGDINITDMCGLWGFSDFGLSPEVWGKPSRVLGRSCLWQLRNLWKNDAGDPVVRGLMVAIRNDNKPSRRYVLDMGFVEVLELPQLIGCRDFDKNKPGWDDGSLFVLDLDTVEPI